ncbi:unnamed protein product [Cochlearia groenlandica]
MVLFAGIAAEALVYDIESNQVGLIYRAVVEALQVGSCLSIVIRRIEEAMSSNILIFYVHFLLHTIHKGMGNESPRNTLLAARVDEKRNESNLTPRMMVYQSQPNLLKVHFWLGGVPVTS